MNTRTTTAALAAGLLLAALTACNGSDNDPKPPATSSPATEASPSSPTPTPAAASTPAALGAAQKFHSDADAETQVAGGTVAVLSYQQPVKSVGSASEEAGTEGYVWAALEVKICGTEGEFTTSSAPWTLAYDDGARIEPTSTTYDDFPKPEYLDDAPISPGDCSRGKIVYPVPGDDRPSKAIYAPADAPTLKWSLPKH